MTYSIAKEYDVTRNKWIVILRGEIDISNAYMLREEFNAVYEELRADMDINVSEVIYIDSTGLGIFIGLYEKMRKRGNRVRLLDPRNSLKKLLKITQFDEVLCNGGGNER
jgi:anti-sigma B factor antagonist